MAQLLIALALVAALVWFVLTRTGSRTEEGSPRPYAGEVQKAEEVQDTLQQGSQMRGDQIEQMMQPGSDEPTEPTDGE